MTKKREVLDRVRKIDKLLNQNDRITRKVLAERLRTTTKTIQRAIKILELEFEAPIKFDNKGYYYTNTFSLPLKLGLTGEEIRQLKLAAKTLNQFKHLDVFKDIEGLFDKIEKSVRFEVSGKSKNHIFFESVPAYKGTKHIDFFLKAIKQQRKVEFEYQSFTSKKVFLHHFCPYFLKEHTNRWYVIGELWRGSEKSISPYALERIIINDKMKMTETPFKIRDGFSLEKHFKHTYGMAVYSEKEVEEIILEFSDTQLKYFKSKPFHSFDKVKDYPNLVKMELIPNYELIRKLAGMGKGVKIIQPKSLQKKLINYLTQAIIQYE